MDNYPHLTLERRKRLFTGAVAIAAICAQYTTLLMAQPEVNNPPQTRASNAQWNDQEVTTLINFLYDHCSEGTGGHFKPKVFGSAAQFINDDEELALNQLGPPKTSKSVRNKWILLKNVYYAIEKYCNQTGVHWDNEVGAGIQDPAAAGVWTTYGQNNNLISPFHNKGWE
ncbi:hypothetical protein DFJ58DRAFT_721232 [Suillus subalutaceus]|uniref:uncharacterized protein n=1 Tax=Suillus subalutaceus TaxID=48586 RepID=UPI001B86E987|nr:uncharacterized protein DFJ58DRAFT_721232 [Suillus subalutaceus]KAG1875396.1 hypothetical protein DFJ58DRAFT_721232 [Suillus subalutaceus]